MPDLFGRIAFNLRLRWRRVFALLVIGVGVIAPFLTGVWWSLPLVWFLGLFILLPLFHTLAKPLPDRSDPGAAADRHVTDPALDTLRDRYARGEIDEATFERTLDTLLETEDLDFQPADGDDPQSISETVSRELDRLRER